MPINFTHFSFWYKPRDVGSFSFNMFNVWRTASYSESMAWTEESKDSHLVVHAFFSLLETPVFELSIVNSLFSTVFARRTPSSLGISVTCPQLHQPCMYVFNITNILKSIRACQSQTMAYAMHTDNLRVFFL